MADRVLQTVPLGFQWPTAEPFLFCVHHLDHYPAGNESHGPAAPLAGRPIGQDFEGIDGWRMYHGSVVPGFPQHPHRGFETITYVRQGLVDHADSMGAAARYGRGDVQWMTAGRGIQHSEMFPLLDAHAPNTLELFQIWLNLPAVDKMVEPHFTMLWDHDIPRHVEVADDGSTVEVTVIAGSLAGVTPPPPPPASWASRTESDLAIWHVRLDPGTTWTLPPAAADDTLRILYVFEGPGLTVDGDEHITDSTGAVVRCDEPLTVAHPGGGGAVEVLVLQARPIGEPIAQQGPFVMNTADEIRQAFADYQATQFGGWPWPHPDPVHGDDPGRFARHADGSREDANATLGT
jgi:redox-sensitive bicupin YhaK (pirin superfamily)